MCSGKLGWTWNVCYVRFKSSACINESVCKSSRDTRLTHPFYFLSTWHEPEIITVMLSEFSFCCAHWLISSVVLGFWSQLCFCRPLKESTYSLGPIKRRYSQSLVRLWDKILSVGCNVKMPLKIWTLTWRLRHKTWTNSKLKPIKRTLNSDWADHRHNTKFLCQLVLMAKFGFVRPCLLSTAYCVLCGFIS